MVAIEKDDEPRPASGPRGAIAPLGHVAPILTRRVAARDVGVDGRTLASPAPVRIHTGIAHRDGHSGWIGIGVASVPRACFEQGLAALRVAMPNRIGADARR